MFALRCLTPPVKLGGDGSGGLMTLDYAVAVDTAPLPARSAYRQGGGGWGGGGAERVQSTLAEKGKT